MMKRFVFYLCALASLTLPAFLASCGGDDEDSSSSGGGETAATKYLVSAITYGSKKMTFSYDDAGRMTSATLWNGYTYDMDYESSALSGAGSGRTISGNLSFNTDGFITALEMTDSSDSNPEGDSKSYSFTYSYDSDGHLTKISGDYNGEPTTAKLTWSGDNLKKSVVEQTIFEGTSVEYTNKITYSYNYGSEDNVYRIPTLAVFYDPLEYYFPLPEFTLCGCFGTGASKLPESWDYSFEVTHVNKLMDSDDDYYSTSHDLSYTLNPDGTINTEDGTYRYSYLTTGTRGASGR